jgi:hypothetical protein
VREVVPAERATSIYICHRSFRKGNTLSLCERAEHVSIWRLSVRFMKGVGNLLLGFSLMVPLYVARRNEGFLWGAVRATWGFGMICGLVGFRSTAYRSK